MTVRNTYTRGLDVMAIDGEWRTHCDHCLKRTATHRVAYPYGRDDKVVDVCPDCLFHDFGRED